MVASLGRLAPEKGLDNLITAFGDVGDAYPEWRLRIFGEGPEGPRLVELAATVAPGRVEWAGWSQRPTESLRQCDLFVLSSHYEGFPQCASRSDGLRIARYQYRL